MDTLHRAVNDSDEIERLYDELDVSECECHAIDSCNFHQKLTRLKSLQNQEIETIERGFHRLQTSILKTSRLFEEIDAGFADVFK